MEKCIISKRRFMSDHLILQLVMTIIAVLGICLISPKVTFAATGDTIKNGDYTYTENSDGTLTLSLYNGTAVKIVVPEKVEGKTVTHIGRLFIANSVVKNVTDVTLPETITTLDSYAFSRCNSLKNINLPESLTVINSYAFYNNYSLEQINLPSNLKVIGSRAFINCTGICELDIPASITSIDGHITEGCESLAAIKIGGDVNGSNSRFKCRDGVLFGPSNNISGSYALLRYPPAKEGLTYEVTERVEAFDEGSFDGCTLEEITLNAEVEDVPNAFDEAMHLKSFKVDPNNPTFLTGVDGDYNSLFKRNSDGTYTFVRYPIGQAASEYTLSDRVTVLDETAFENCIYLNKVNLGGVKKLDAGTFRGCQGLTSVNLPATVEDIYSTAFMECINLAEIKVADENTVYASKEGVLYSKDFKKLVIYPAGKPDKSYTVADGCESIGAMAFDDVRYLEEINLAGIMTIGRQAFERTKSLKQITFDENVASLKIGDGVFSNNQALSRIVFPANLTSLGDEVFNATRNLKKVFFWGPCPQMDTGDSIVNSAQNFTFYVKPEYMSGYETFITQHVSPAKVTLVEWNGEEVPDLDVYDMSGVKFTDKTYTYDGAGKSIAITGTLPSGVKVTYSGNNVKSVGNHKVMASFSGDSKHETIPPMFAYITILKAKNRFNGPEAPTAGLSGIKWNIKSAFGSVRLTYSTSAKGSFTGTAPVKPGIYYVKAEVKGTDNYSGISKVATVTLLPKGTLVTKLTPGKKRLKIKWKKQGKYTNGYEIQYSTSSKFKKGTKTVTIKKAATTSKVIKKIKARKKYYVRIRTYYKNGGKTFRSAWSKAKMIKVK